VRARLVGRPEDWRWSSARAHLGLAGDGLTRVEPLLSRIGDWTAFLGTGLEEAEAEAIRTSERSGLPLGSDAFRAALAAAAGIELVPSRRGRRRKQEMGTV
jgi:putative transposase